VSAANPANPGSSDEQTQRPISSTAQGMNYLVSLPRRVVTVYVPLGAFLFRAALPVLLDGHHDLQPNEELRRGEG